MTSPIRLTQQNLSQLPPDIARPTYDRSQVTTGIVHVGVGGFHRSHEAFYIDKLLQSGEAQEWGICGVGLRDADRKMANILQEQDYLYTLVIKHPDGRRDTQVIGSIIDFLMGCDDPSAVIDRMAAEETKIVSLTITEGGYNVDPDTGEFDASNPDVQHDIANPTTPRLVFGYLTAALKKRREAGLPAFTVQSCDNIQHNGNLTRRMLLGFAKLQDPELAEWIEHEVRFPNAMVDRITPVTSAADIEYLKSEHNLVDEWPVACEPFCQWVIEDQFSAGRPDLQTVGVQFVPDVTPYETMKLRLLNAGHSVLGIPGAVYGYQTIDECMRDDLFVTFLRQFFDQEATPTLEAVAGIDLEVYKQSLVERFGNPSISDHVSRICLGSSSKLPVFLLPTIQENLERGGPIERSAFVLAAWCYYSDKHADRHGNPLEINEDKEAALQEVARKTSDDPLAFIRLKSVFGDLAENATFASLYEQFVTQIYENPDVTVWMRQITQA